jgi:putative nucleotidyltransferase with HDIG domain
MISLRKTSIERIVLVFVVIASLWVLLADLLFPSLASNLGMSSFLRVYQRIGFVVFSGVLIYILLVVETRRTSPEFLTQAVPLPARIPEEDLAVWKDLDLFVERWVQTLELRNLESEQHCQHVAEMTVELARQFGFSEIELEHIRRGAWLHDIGKVAVPESILMKTGPLNEAERAVMQKHPEIAHDLLMGIPSLALALDIPYCHHERWDGAGYPRQLKGEEIPLAARIFAVIEVWDAMTSDRPYRKALPARAAITYIRCQSGTQFDPQVVEKFLQLEQIQAARHLPETVFIGKGTADDVHSRNP